MDFYELTSSVFGHLFHQAFGKLDKQNHRRITEIEEKSVEFEEERKPENNKHKETRRCNAHSESIAYTWGGCKKCLFPFYNGTETFVALEWFDSMSSHI